MRTTVTLEADVAEALKRATRERGASFKQTINDAIRAGLASGRQSGKPYRMKPRKLSALPGADLTKALGLAAAMEDEEIVRKLELRK